MLKLYKSLKFDDKGLIPAVVQDWRDNTVLMVAYMNRESIRRTLRLKKCVFWSRSRQSFWLKGESSGNVQKVKELRIDCDGDCLLVKVEPRPLVIPVSDRVFIAKLSLEENSK